MTSVETTAEASSPPREFVLGTVGRVTCSVAVSSRPWEVAIDTLVISVGAKLGDLGAAVRQRFTEARWESVDLESIRPESPTLLDLWGQYGHGTPDVPLQRVVMATVRDPSLPRADDGEHQASLFAVGLAAQVCIEFAAEHGCVRLGLPLLGAGSIGFSPAAVASAILPAAHASLRSAAASGLERLVFVCKDEASKAAISAAWDATAAVQAAPERRAPRVDTALPALSASAAAVLSTPVLAGPGPVVETGAVLCAALWRSVREGRHDVAAALLDLVVDEDPSEVAFPGRLSSAANVSFPVLPVDFPKPGQTVLGLPGVEPLVRRAATIASRAGQAPEVHVRHLLGAVATAEPPLPPPVLDVLGVTPGELRERLREAVHRALPDEPMSGWDDVLGIRHEEAELAGGMSADLVNPEEGIPLDRDHLGVGTYVTMLATVVANRETPLPLSIGLFGEWGSGKSYFMGLLREQIRLLSESGDAAYHSDVVQIVFNAWTYADTNLWASLGNEIFGQLAGPAPDPDERRRRLRADLDRKLQRAQELEAAKEKARTETVRLRTELEQAREARQQSVVSLLAAAGTGAAKAELDRVWARLGIGDAVEQGQLLANEVRGVRTDASAVRLAMTGWRGFWAAILAAALVLLLVVGLLLPADVRRWLTGGGLAGLAGLLAAGALAVARVRIGLQSLTRVAQNMRASAAQRAEESVAAELDEVRSAEAQERVLQVQLDEVLIRAGELGRELAGLTPGQRLYGFLTERASSDDYRRELGLISTVRRDFKELVSLMHEWEEERRTSSDGERPPHPIDRIVLYIDDLDRCSPQQVVDVLQAVHLLLALDLFVVVVGVDPRWLLHSLRQQYRNILGSEGGGPSTGPAAGDDTRSWRSTPQDYLEKIFNIPFVLPAMTSESFGLLIRDLSTGGRSAAPPLASALAPATADGEPEPGAAPGPDRETAPAPTPDQRRLAEPGPALPTPSPTAPAVELGSEVAAIRQGIRPVPRALTEAELRLISALAPLVQSPREAKRLLNLYRMIRSTRDLSVASRFLGKDDRPGEFQAVVLLLGLLTAYPRLLGDVLSAPPDPVRGVPGGICHRRPGDAGWREVVAGLRPRQRGSGWQNDVCVDLDETARTEWDQVVSRVAAATDQVTLPDLAAFRTWGPHIARFSFVLSPLAGATPDPGPDREVPS